MSYTYPYPRPMVTVDIFLLSLEGDELQLLLIQRGHLPFEGKWALPGGYVEIEEPLRTAAQRELQEETGLKDVPLTALEVAGDPKRDPRGRTISVIFAGALSADMPHSARGGDDARLARWFPVNKLPALAFDHDRVVANCLDKFRFNALLKFWVLLFLAERGFSAEEFCQALISVNGVHLKEARAHRLLMALPGVQKVKSTHLYRPKISKQQILDREDSLFLRFWAEQFV